MPDDKLKRCLELLDYFSVKQTKKYIYLTSGDNSVICNPNTEWKDFLGCSISGVARAVAKELNKEIKYKKS